MVEGEQTAEKGRFDRYLLIILALSFRVLGIFMIFQSQIYGVGRVCTYTSF